MIWAVVPAKLGKNSKERLAPVLAPDLRERLARAMLLEVIHALRSCPAVQETIVISQDEAALELARSAGARPLQEGTRKGLNASVEEAARHCIQRGASAILIAMGDLPLLRADDATGALARLPKRGIVLVPSADGTGTNLVAARPPDLFRPEFGPGSLARHLEQCGRGTFETIVHESAGAALDIDTPADLERLRDAADPTTTSGELLRLARGEARVTIGA